jgi:hypothetical protein
MKGDTVVAAGREDNRARREARTIAAFLNGGPPDFLMTAMLTAIAEAFDYFGMPQPDGDYDEQNLRPLFLKTKLISWDSFGLLESAKASADICGTALTPIGARILQFRKGAITPIQ